MTCRQLGHASLTALADKLAGKCLAQVAANGL